MQLHSIKRLLYSVSSSKKNHGVFAEECNCMIMISSGMHSELKWDTNYQERYNYAEHTLLVSFVTVFISAACASFSFK